MASATVTLKLDPSDFDVVRDALQSVVAAAARLAADAGDPKARRAARERAIKAGDVLRQLNL